MSKALLLIASACTVALGLVLTPAPIAQAHSSSSAPKTWVSVKHHNNPTFHLKTGKPGRVIMKVNGRTHAVRHTGQNRYMKFRAWAPYGKVTNVSFKMVGHHWAKFGAWRTVHVDRRPQLNLTQEQKVLRVAKAQVGKPYRWGSGGPSSFDCSGLVQYSYRVATGRNLPHQSTAIKNTGKRIPRSQAKPGDLVWTPGHIAIYAGGGRVVEAANPRSGVTYRTMWQHNPVFLRI